MAVELSKLLHETANAKVGIWEWAEGSNPLINEMFAKAGFPEITEDATPWCAAFVGSVLAECGLMPSGSLAARSYLPYGEPVLISEAVQGDIAVFWRGSKDDWRGHVGFVHSIDAHYIYVLGGNQSDQVNIKPYPRSQLLDIRRAKQPRTSPTDSKTIRAVGGAAVAVTTAATQVVTEADPNLTLLAMLIVLGFLAYIFRERLKAWAAGWR